MEHSTFDPDAGWSRVEGTYVNGPYVIEKVADGWWLRRLSDDDHDNLGTFETLRDAKQEAVEVEDEHDGIETPELDRHLASLGVTGRPVAITYDEPSESYPKTFAARPAEIKAEEPIEGYRPIELFGPTPVEGGTILWFTAAEIARKSETIASLLGMVDGTRVIGVVVDREKS